MNDRSSTSQLVRFGPFEVDLESGQLRKGGVKVRLQEQPFRVLSVLIERPGEVVTRDELRERLWSDDTFVEFEQGLNAAVNRLRSALSDSANDPRWIETLPWRGYRFAADITESWDDPSRAAAAQSINGVGSRRPERLALVAATACALLLGLGGGRYLADEDPAGVAPVRRFALTASPPSLKHWPTISPDGRHVSFASFISGLGEEPALWVQDLDHDEPRLLEETGRTPYPSFWSPDSEFIAYKVRGELRKISVHGGHSSLICPLPPDIGYRAFYGGAWSPDGSSIVFSSGPNFSSGPEVALFEVPSEGGEPERLNVAAPVQPWSPPRFLPDAGDRVLLFSGDVHEAGSTFSQMYAENLDTGQSEVLGPGSRPEYSAATGHLLYKSGWDLWARPFSPETLRFTGTAFKIRAKTGRFSVSEDGTLAYKDPSNRFIRRNLVWRSRNGELLETIVESEAVIDPSLSPDGRRVAVTSRESEYEEIWIYDLLSDAKTRLTFDDVGQSKPTWSPSGREIAYRQEVRYSYAHTSSQRRETRAILRQSADGSGEAVSLVESEDAVRLHWSGRHLVYSVLKRDSHSRRDLRYLELEPSGVSEPITWLATPFSEADPRLSPDGRFLAYASDESDESYSERSAFEIYVRPFPEGPGKWQVSSNGGILPRWRADAKELYYMQGRTVMAVTVSLLASA